MRLGPGRPSSGDVLVLVAEKMSKRTLLREREPSYIPYQFSVRRAIKPNLLVFLSGIDRIYSSKVVQLK